MQGIGADLLEGEVPLLYEIPLTTEIYGVVIFCCNFATPPSLSTVYHDPRTTSYAEASNTLDQTGLP